MGDKDFAAVLFYSDGHNPQMRAGGKMTPGKSTKILWSIPKAGDAELTVNGISDNGHTFAQRITGIGGGQYPSVANVPTAGCWTLRETVRGKTVGTITVPVSPAIGT